MKVMLWKNHDMDVLSNPHRLERVSERESSAD